MKTSIIIPTLNRINDLRCALKSIQNQTVQANEVIIVDQGDNKQVEKLIKEFSNLNIVHIYLHIKSAALARNKAVEKSNYDLLIFLDDDVELDKHYIERAIEYMQLHTDIIAVTGKDLKYKHSKNILKRLIGVLFCLSSFSNRSRVLISGQNVLRNCADSEQEIEWLSGCNMVIRKKVFNEGIEFNRSFVKWSFGEDVMLSYQIFKKYKNSLRYVPNLKFYHNLSSSSRMPNHELIRMKIIYRYIFWRSEVYSGTLSLFAYLWSQIGLFMLDILHYKSLNIIMVALETYYFVYKNRHNILHHTVDYNKFILK